MTLSKKQYSEALRTEWRTAAFYRDLLAEFTATFVLMTVQCALPAPWGIDGMGSVVQTGLGMAAVVGATAWTFGDFGGAHMNPAVTFAMMLLANVTIIRAVVYVGVQCAAGVAGAYFVDAVTPRNLSGNLAATVLHPDMEPWQGVLVEVWLTFVLVMTVLGAANSARKGNVYMPTIIVAMAVYVGVSCGFNSTGGSMNPARTLGPAVVRSLWEYHWIYWAGPLGGAALAALMYGALFDLVDHPGRDRDVTYTSSDNVLGSEEVAKYRIKHASDKL